MHLCVQRKNGGRCITSTHVYATLNFAASPHLVQLVVDFVENECPVIVISVLLHHLVNCDLVREEGGEKKEEEGEGSKEERE